MKCLKVAKRTFSRRVDWISREVWASRASLEVSGRESESTISDFYATMT